MRLLDLYCGAGGSAYGYWLAGFDIVGVDIEPQPNYPFPFVQADALEYLAEHGHEFDAVHASPPCQAYSLTQPVTGKEYPELLAPTRDLLHTMGISLWVIENVPTAPLNDPILLCGAIFGLRTYRHRLFEVHGAHMREPVHPEHVAKVAKMGRPPKPDEFMHVVGNFSGAREARQAMGINWMTRAELAEAVPPAYTKYVGDQLMDELKYRAAFEGDATMMV